MVGSKMTGERDNSGPAIRVSHVSHRYQTRVALDDVTVEVAAGEMFAMLGPNGGGKTTLFRLLSTALKVQTGSIEVLGNSTVDDPLAVRMQLGVVFQSPSLDKKLSVRENLIHHARLYGMARRDYLPGIERSLGLLGLSDRAKDRVEQLSGGLARRVEIAKALLHLPRILILDEPSTGLDPAARSDLWRYLVTLPAEGVTILTTTHLMEEAERCQRVGILHQGRLVALGRPADLRAEIGRQLVTIQTKDAAGISSLLRQRLGVEATAFGEGIRFEHAGPLEEVARVLDGAATSIDSVSFARPTLEDLFLKRTGHRFWGEPSDG
jgi:ABC-2 type transport system ATP-binding protein